MKWRQHIVFALRDHERLREIARVVAQFGLEDALQRMGVAEWLPSIRSHRDAQSQGTALPQRVTAAMGALGPAFVKLGQILAVREDILAPEWISAFRTLHSQASPLPWEDIRPQIEAALGDKPEAYFSAFDPTPVAAGSIAQIHKAILATSATSTKTESPVEVAVKVQRPGIAPRIEADMRIIHHLARAIEDKNPQLAWLHLPDIARTLADALREELDFTREARNAERIAAQFAGQQHIVIPHSFPALSQPTLLVQEFVHGQHPHAPDTLRHEGLNPEVLAERGTQAVLQMTLVDGFFHADPHPGNILCLPENRIAFLDFGMVGQLSPRRRDEVLMLIDGIVQERTTQVRDVMLAWAGSEVMDLTRLEADIGRFVSRHRMPPLEFSQAINDFLAMARTHKMHMPHDLLLLFKTLVTAEGVARSLHPDIDVIAQAAPLAQAGLRRTFSPDALWQTGMAWLMEARNLQPELPAALRGLMRMLQRGRLPLDVRTQELVPLARSVEYAGKKIAIALLAGAALLAVSPRLYHFEDTLSAPYFTLAITVLIICAALWLSRSNRSN